VYSKDDSIPYLVVHSFKFQCQCNELDDAKFQLRFNFTNRRETPYIENIAGTQNHRQVILQEMNENEIRKAVFLQ
jgi:hypothetical protein